MKIAIAYNRDSQRVINLFGIPNREKYGLAAIKRISDGLRKGGHQVKAFEGDKDLIDNLEEFMPRVLKGERPGMVFNVSYGIQGQARYTHVPAILEMVGIPYVGSGPLAHSLALDKVVAKMIFRQHGLPTPDFAVLDGPDFPAPDLAYPLIVKPKNEAVSFGIRVVHDEAELRDAAGVIFAEFEQPALVERYIDGREINVGVLGNDDPLTFPPVEIGFGASGPKIYTMEDKQGKSGRDVQLICPAQVDAEITARAQQLAKKAFHALGCYDCCRVDMRIDQEGNLYLLEINSLPSLGARGSYVHAAEHIGLDFPALINRLVEVASARYFGTPHPPVLRGQRRDKGAVIFSHLTGRRDRLEDRVRRWTRISSRTDDPIGTRSAAKFLGQSLADLGMTPVRERTNDRETWTWQTPAGFAGGTLLIAHLDVPQSLAESQQGFRREPEWLHGEGIGCSRAPLAMAEFALRAVNSAGLLKKRRIGLLAYADEGNDAAHSADVIRQAASEAARVLVLRPGSMGEHIVTDRRGLRTYQLVIEGSPRRLDKNVKKPDPLLWASAKLEQFAGLSSPEDRLSIAAASVRTSAFRMLLPHRVTVTLHVAYANAKHADEAEAGMRNMLNRPPFAVDFELTSDRPALPRRRNATALAKQLGQIAEQWEAPIKQESSAWPSVAGLVPKQIPVVCGVGPVAVNLYTPQEAVSRTSLVRRTLLLAQFLADAQFQADTVSS